MALSDDHLNILALAQSALEAQRSDLWRTNVERALATHSAACDALWLELERQLAAADGQVPHLLSVPELQRLVSYEMRARIIGVVCDALEQMGFDEV